MGHVIWYIYIFSVSDYYWHLLPSFQSATLANGTFSVSVLIFTTTKFSGTLLPMSSHLSLTTFSRRGAPAQLVIAWSVRVIGLLSCFLFTVVETPPQRKERSRACASGITHVVAKTSGQADTIVPNVVTPIVACLLGLIVTRAAQGVHFFDQTRLTDSAPEPRCCQYERIL